MKLLKKLMLTLALVVGMTFAADAQSSWSTGRVYQYQGESWTQWQNVIVGYDNWGNAIVRTKCRATSWYQEQYSGYVYVWGNGGWYTQYYSGYAWRCSWGNWYWC